MTKWIGGTIAVLLILIGSVLFGFLHMFYWSPASTSSEVVYYEVPSGASIATIARDLEGTGVVKDASLFHMFMKVFGVGKNLKKGEYSLRKDMTPEEVIEVLTSGRSIGRNFTVSEGLNLFEIADLWEAQGFGQRTEFLHAARDSQRIMELLGESASSFEGYLYPDTYQITKYMHAQALITRMVNKFLATYKSIEAADKNMEKRIRMNRREIVTLASIVEKETGDPRERPIISAVFHNRMRLGMKLQTDPTILYGKALDMGKVILSITRADLQNTHPYNTYHIRGLPPGPIANPGREALLATVQPAQTRYLFFVSQNDGTHIFSETYEGHRKAVREYQMNPRARQGKSWRDLNKKKSPEQSR